MSRIVKSLNGTDWKLQYFRDGEGYRNVLQDMNYTFEGWMPSTVPGDVRVDLLHNGKIEDPFFGKNNLKSQWVHNFEWWYLKEFTLQPSDISGKVIQLVFKGVDYFAEFWLNGTKLGEHEGSFAKISFDITKIIQNQNTLLVRLAPMKNYRDRFEVLKCQMSYGWDFAPKMITSGIWDDVTLELHEPLYIDSCFVHPLLESPDSATVKVKLDLVNHLSSGVVLIKLKVQGKNFQDTPISAEFQKTIEIGSNQIEVEMKVKAPQLWYPWDKGKPNLYRCTIEIIHGEESVDAFEETFGIRNFELLSQNISPDHYPWIFQLNGEREFIRGGNWVPCDSLFGRINQDRYLQNVQLAKKANINLLRVWGGGLKEKDAFYRICDEEGMLVWQEFPIACAFISPLPKDEKFLNLWKEEAESIVKSLRNHPSLLLWCGGNEFHSVTNAHVVVILKKAVETLDSRVFIPASPEGGDNHNYEVFHGAGPYSIYLDDNFPFTSEFGLNALPNYATLDKIVPKEEQYFWSPTINYRGQYMAITNAHKLRLQRYALPFQPSDDLQSIIKASQQAQGLGLKTAIEHYRRRKLNWQHAGCAFWQVDSPWPGVSFCIIEHDFETKLAYDYIRIAYQPILLSLKYDLKMNFTQSDKQGHLVNRRFEAEVFLINDLNRRFPNCTFRCTFLTQDYKVLHTIERPLEVPENTCVQLDPLSYEIPDTLTAPPRIHMELLSNGELISKNFYNLRYYDPIQMRRMAKYSKRMSDIMMYGKGSRISRLLNSGAYGALLLFSLLSLYLKINWKWKHRKKDEFEYEKLEYLKE
ncbi:MAG: hypothetical protein LUQ65_00545 [Candidatus Helarchaeota archaeon]|nr:hypothetical protein [Candidatus Helarchaeota archaeon]